MVMVNSENECRDFSVTPEFIDNERLSSWILQDNLGLSLIEVVRREPFFASQIQKHIDAVIKLPSLWNNSYKWVCRQTLRSISVGSILHQDVIEWLIPPVRQTIDTHLCYPRITHLARMIPSINYTAIIVPQQDKSSTSIIIIQARTAVYRTFSRDVILASQA